MSEASQAIETYVKLLRSSNLNSYIRIQLEYILYQLNLSVLKGERINTGATEIPFKAAEIELLNSLILAAGNGETGSRAAGKELSDRLFRIITRFHADNEGPASGQLTTEGH